MGSKYVPPEYDRHDPYDPEVMHGGKAQTGDVCPWCGDPIKATQDLSGPRGNDPGDISDWGPRIFHADCYPEALAAKRRDENQSLGDFAGGEQ